MTCTQRPIRVRYRPEQSLESEGGKLSTKPSKASLAVQKQVGPSKPELGAVRWSLGRPTLGCCLELSPTLKCKSRGSRVALGSGTRISAAIGCRTRLICDRAAATCSVSPPSLPPTLVPLLHALQTGTAYCGNPTPSIRKRLVSCSDSPPPPLPTERAPAREHVDLVREETSVSPATLRVSTSSSEYSVYPANHLPAPFRAQSLPAFDSRPTAVRGDTALHQQTNGPVLRKTESISPPGNAPVSKRRQAREGQGGELTSCPRGSQFLRISESSVFLRLSPASTDAAPAAPLANFKQHGRLDLDDRHGCMLED